MATGGVSRLSDDKVAPEHLSEEEQRPLLSANGDSHEDDSPNASVPASMFNLINTVIGAGVLALPFAFAASGLLLGLLFLLIVLGLSVYSVVLLVSCASLSGLHRRATYREVARHAFGTGGVITTDISLILACFGALCSYLVIIADMIAPLIAYWSNKDELEVNRTTIVGIAACLLFPLATLRYLSFYKYISLGALCAISYLTFVVVYRR